MPESFRHQITSEEYRTVLELLKRHLPGTTAWIYGSRVKWTSKTGRLNQSLTVYRPGGPSPADRLTFRPEIPTVSVPSPDSSSVHYPGAQDTRASLCHNRFQSVAP